MNKRESAVFWKVQLLIHFHFHHISSPSQISKIRTMNQKSALLFEESEIRFIIRTRRRRVDLRCIPEYDRLVMEGQPRNARLVRRLCIWWMNSQLITKFITRIVSDVTTARVPSRQREHLVTLPLTLVHKKKKRSSLSLMPSLPQGSEEVGSEILGPGQITTTSLFQEIKCFEDFHIVVEDGICIDNELPEDVRKDYYELCRGKQEFLHELVPKDVVSKSVAGMICQTVKIANQIKVCEPTTKQEEFEAWDKSLKSCEQLGMKVGFLRDMVSMLLSLVLKSEEASHHKIYMEAKMKKDRVEEVLKKLEEKASELKQTCQRFDDVMDPLKDMVERYEAQFRQAVNTFVWDRYVNAIF